MEGVGRVRAGVVMNQGVGGEPRRMVQVAAAVWMVRPVSLGVMVPGVSQSFRQSARRVRSSVSVIKGGPAQRGTGPAMMAGSMVRGSHFPSLRAPVRAPFSMTILPRRRVMQGQAWASQPSQGV